LRPAANLQDVLLSRTKSHIGLHREPAKLQNGNVVYAKMLAAAYVTWMVCTIHEAKKIAEKSMK